MFVSQKAVHSTTICIYNIYAVHVVASAPFVIGSFFLAEIQIIFGTEYVQSIQLLSQMPDDYTNIYPRLILSHLNLVK